MTRRHYVELDTKTGKVTAYTVKDGKVLPPPNLTRKPLRYGTDKGRRRLIHDINNS